MATYPALQDNDANFGTQNSNVRKTTFSVEQCLTVTVDYKLKKGSTMPSDAMRQRVS